MGFGLAMCEAPGCNTEFEKGSWNSRYHSEDCKQLVKNLARRKTVPSSEEAVQTFGARPLHLDNEEQALQLEFLRAENRRLSTATERYKRSKIELVDAVYQAAHDALSRLELKPIRPPKERPSRGEEEVANPVCGDWQYAKVTPTFSSEVCAERISLYGDKVIDLTEIQRSDHPVNRCHVHFLGDQIEGEQIFGTQAYLIDRSLYRQVVETVEVTVDLLRRMLSTFQTVHVVGVAGNHGQLRGRSDYNPESNMDRLVYKFTEMIFKDEKRITFKVPEGYGETNFYAVDNIGLYNVLLMHGDQLPAPSSVSSYVKKVLGWKAGAIPEQFLDVFIGHWHQPTKMTIGNGVLRIVGSPESTNTFAQEKLAAMGRPSQHMQFIHPQKGIVTCEYDVYLD